MINGHPCRRSLIIAMMCVITQIVRTNDPVHWLDQSIEINLLNINQINNVYKNCDLRLHRIMCLLIKDF